MMLVGFFLKLVLKWSRIRLREIEMDDCARLAALHAQSFAHAWDKHEIENMMLRGDRADVLLLEGALGRFLGQKMIVGFAISRLTLDEAELLTITLDKRIRGLGYSALLLGAHIKQLRRAGAGVLFLEVASDNQPARALYNSMGFDEIGLRKGYYPPNIGEQKRIDALTMRLNLDVFDPFPREF